MLGLFNSTWLFYVIIVIIMSKPQAGVCQSPQIASILRSTMHVSAYPDRMQFSIDRLQVTLVNIYTVPFIDLVCVYHWMAVL